MFKLWNICFELIIFFSNIYLLKSQQNDNIISLRFKTYYPFSINYGNNYSSFNTDDYFESIHLSKIYLEIGVGDQNSFETKINQYLNVIIDLKENIFSTTNIYFEKYAKENNDILCHFNTSKSSTFGEIPKYYDLYNIKTLSSYAHDYFQIYTDLSLTKYKIEKLNFVNTINHNISTICGNIGLGYTHRESVDYNFISQLHYKFNLSEYSFLFNYSSNYNDEGTFIFGNMPYKYSPKIFNIYNLIPIYSTSSVEPIINLYELKIERDGFLIDSKDHKLKINPDIEGFEFPEINFIDIEDIFFQKYYSKNICHQETYKRVYKIIYCEEGKENFGIKDIKAFPNITFYIDKSINLSINFNGDDLFYFRNNKYYFKIVGNTVENYLILGRILFKKCLTVFNQDKKQIYFYNKNYQDKNNNNNDEYSNDKKNNQNNIIKIIIIVSIICALIFFPLGIYFGTKLFKKRTKKAYELKDGYEYPINKEQKDNLIINS